MGRDAKLAAIEEERKEKKKQRDAEIAIKKAKADERIYKTGAHYPTNLVGGTTVTLREDNNNNTQNGKSLDSGIELINRPGAKFILNGKPKKVRKDDKIDQIEETIDLDSEKDEDYIKILKNQIGHRNDSREGSRDSKNNFISSGDNSRENSKARSDIPQYKKIERQEREERRRQRQKEKREEKKDGDRKDKKLKKHKRRHVEGESRKVYKRQNNSP